MTAECKAQYRGADDERYDDHDAPAQHHTRRFMMGHSDFGDRTTNLFHNGGAVRFGGLGHAESAFGFKLSRMSKLVRSAPASGPGTRFTHPRVGRAKDGVTTRARRRIRNASPPAHTGSVS